MSQGLELKVAGMEQAYTALATEKGVVQYSTLETPDPVKSVHLQMRGVRDRYRGLAAINLDDAYDLPVEWIQENDAYQVQWISQNTINVDIGEFTFRLVTANKQMRILFGGADITDQFTNDQDEYLVDPETFGNHMRHWTSLVRDIMLGVYDSLGMDLPQGPITLEQRGVAEKKKPKYSGEYHWLIEQIRREVRGYDWDNVVGQEEAVEQAKQLQLSLKRPKIYRQWGLTPIKGVLMTGPPGTGKTTLAKVVASKTDASFFYVGLKDVMNMWHGEDSNRMSAIFEAARMEDHSIIFLDELEQIARARTGSYRDTLVTTILTNMDGIESTDNVTVIGATNRPEILDAGIIDRLPIKLTMNYPDAKGNYNIFMYHAKRMQKKAKRTLLVDAPDVQWEVLFRPYKTLSGRTIVNTLERAIRARATDEVLTDEINPVTPADIRRELERAHEVRKEIDGTDDEAWSNG